MPGSGLHRRTDKTNCQPATRGVQGKALFKGVQGEVQDGALNGNSGEEPLDWFRKKFQEIKEKLGLNTPVENKQRKGLKI